MKNLINFDANKTIESLTDANIKLLAASVANVKHNGKLNNSVKQYVKTLTAALVGSPDLMIDTKLVFNPILKDMILALVTATTPRGDEVNPNIWKKEPANIQTLDILRKSFQRHLSNSISIEGYTIAITKVSGEKKADWKGYMKLEFKEISQRTPSETSTAETDEVKGLESETKQRPMINADVIAYIKSLKKQSQINLLNEIRESDALIINENAIIKNLIGMTAQALSSAQTAKAA